jgi:hypothetical protein
VTRSPEAERPLVNRVRDVLNAAREPMTAREIATVLPDCNADSVAAALSKLARDRRITRHHNGDGILRYTSGDPSDARRPEPAPKARVYKAPVDAAPVQTIVGTEAPAPARRTPGVPPGPNGDQSPGLQALVRAVVESDPDRRWTHDEILAEVIKHNPTIRKPHRNDVRNRLSNLTRSGYSSPLRRMPADGTFMVNTPGAKAAAEAEAKEDLAAARAKREQRIDAAYQAALDRANDGPAAAAAVPVVDREAIAASIDRQDGKTVAARPAPRQPEMIEEPERTALRDLIAAVVTHVTTPPEPVVRALSRGLETLGARAA